MQFKNRRGCSPHRRGTAIILVMAVLGLLLLLGTAFISVSRLDRAATKNISYNTQADFALRMAVSAIVSEIRADMFSPVGSYLLTPGIQSYAGGFDTFSQGATRPVPIDETRGEYMDIPNPFVDSWLSPTEPELTFTSIAKSRSGNSQPAGKPVWTNVAVVGEPYLPWFRDPYNRMDVPVDPNWRLRNQDNELEPALADADGDGVVDAIWCLLPGGGLVGELRWEIATRVVDLSSMINLNNAIRPITRANETAPLTSPVDQAENENGHIGPAFLARYHTGTGNNGYLLADLLDYVGGNQAGTLDHLPRLLYAGIQETNKPFPDRAQTRHLLGVAVNQRAPRGMNAFSLGNEIEYRFRNGLDRPEVRVLGEGVPETFDFNTPLLGNPRAFGSSNVDFSVPLNRTSGDNAGEELARASGSGGSNAPGGSGRFRTRHLFTTQSAVANFMVGKPLDSDWEFETTFIAIAGGTVMRYWGVLGSHVGQTNFFMQTTEPNIHGGYSVHRGLVRGQNYVQPFYRDAVTAAAWPNGAPLPGTVVDATTGFNPTARMAGKSLSVITPGNAGQPGLLAWKGGTTLEVPMQTYHGTGGTQAGYRDAFGRPRRLSETNALMKPNWSSYPFIPIDFAPSAEEHWSARARQYRASVHDLAHRAIAVTRGGDGRANPMFGFMPDTRLTNYSGAVPASDVYWDRIVPNPNFHPNDPLIASTNSGNQPAKYLAENFASLRTRKEGFSTFGVSAERAQRWWYIKELADIIFVATYGYTYDSFDDSRNLLFPEADHTSGNHDGTMFVGQRELRPPGQDEVVRGLDHYTSTGFEYDMTRFTRYIEKHALMSAGLAVNIIDFIDHDNEPTLFTYVYINQCRMHDAPINNNGMHNTDTRQFVRVVGVEHTPVITNVTGGGGSFTVTLYNPWDADISVRDLRIADFVWRRSLGGLGVATLQGAEFRIPPFESRTFTVNGVAGAAPGHNEPLTRVDWTNGLFLVHRNASYTWLDAWGRNYMPIITQPPAASPNPRLGRDQTRRSRNTIYNPRQTPKVGNRYVRGSSAIFPVDTNYDPQDPVSQIQLTKPYQEIDEQGVIRRSPLSIFSGPGDLERDGLHLTNPIDPNLSNAHLSPAARWFTTVDLEKVPVFCGVYAVPLGGLSIGQVGINNPRPFSGGFRLNQPFAHHLPMLAVAPPATGTLDTLDDYLVGPWYSSTGNGRLTTAGPLNSSPANGVDGRPRYMYTWADRALEAHNNAENEYEFITAGKIDWYKSDQEIINRFGITSLATKNWATFLANDKGWHDQLTGKVTQFIDPRTIRVGGRRDTLRPTTRTTSVPTTETNYYVDYWLLPPAQRLFMFFSEYDPLIDLANNDANSSVDVDGAQIRLSTTDRSGKLDHKVLPHHPWTSIEGTLYGLININTAPYRVLRYLPWTNGNSEIRRVRGVTEEETRDGLARAIIAYRNKNSNPIQEAGGQGSLYAAHAGDRADLQRFYEQLRDSRGEIAYFALARRQYGFMSTGELLNLVSTRVNNRRFSIDQWADIRPTAAGSYPGMANLSGGPAAGAPAEFGDLDYRHGNWTGAAANPQPGWNTPVTPGRDLVLNSLDERSQLMRNVISSITTRSDTFVVYVQVRARNKAGDIVNNRRVFFLVDRTNVRMPHDQPRVIGPFEN